MGHSIPILLNRSKAGTRAFSGATTGVFGQRKSLKLEAERTSYEPNLIQNRFYDSLIKIHNKEVEHQTKHTSPKKGAEGVSVADESIIGYDLRSRVKKSIKDYDASTMLVTGDTVQ